MCPTDVNFDSKRDSLTEEQLWTLLSRLFAEFRNSPPPGHPASAPREKLCFTWNRRQTKRTLTGFTPCPAALEWCLPVWRGFTVYWHFYRFVQVGYELLISTVSFIILLFGMGSFKKEKGVGYMEREKWEGDDELSFDPSWHPAGISVTFSPAVCACAPPRPSICPAAMKHSLLQAALITPVEMNRHNKCLKGTKGR